MAFEYQPMASVVLTQPSSYKRAESNLLVDKRGFKDKAVVLGYTSKLIHLPPFLNKIVLNLFYTKNNRGRRDILLNSSPSIGIGLHWIGSPV